MLKSLEQIFETSTIEVNDGGERVPVHSNTSREQGVFLQKIFDFIKPEKSLEIGFAFGISTLFILEKHREINSVNGAHLVIEPDKSWGNAAVHNIEKEGLSRYLDIRNDYSDKVLSQLFLDNHRIQYAYVDTSKKFDVVMHDFYLINKILDVGGVIILDDCGGGWPGIQRVARFINILPNYKVLEGFNKYKDTVKKKIAESIVSFFIASLPFKKRLYSTIDFKTDRQLNLDYYCIAFQKISVDNRDWNWDRPF